MCVYVWVCVGVCGPCWPPWLAAPYANVQQVTHSCGLHFTFTPRNGDGSVGWGGTSWRVHPPFCLAPLTLASSTDVLSPRKRQAGLSSYAFARPVPPTTLNAFAGYLLGRGAIEGPKGVACQHGVVAVSAWSSDVQHVVHLLDASARTPLWIIGGDASREDGMLYRPYGVRIVLEGSQVAVVDRMNKRVSLFCTKTGRFVKHAIAGVPDPYDVEEVPGGWLVASDGLNSVVMVELEEEEEGQVGRGGQRIGLWTPPTAVGLDPKCGLGKSTWEQGVCSVALVSNLGLVVRGYDGFCQVRVLRL